MNARLEDPDRDNNLTRRIERGCDLDKTHPYTSKARPDLGTILDTIIAVQFVAISREQQVAVTLPPSSRR